MEIVTKTSGFYQKGSAARSLKIWPIGDDRGCYLKISLLGEFSEGNEKMNDLTEKLNSGLNTLLFG